MGLVDDPVEDGIGKGQLAKQVMLAIDRDLAGGQGGAAAMAVFDNPRAKWRCSSPSGLRPNYPGRGF